MWKTAAKVDRLAIIALILYSLWICNYPLSSYFLHMLINFIKKNWTSGWELWEQMISVGSGNLFYINVISGIFQYLNFCFSFLRGVWSIEILSGEIDVHHSQMWSSINWPKRNIRNDIRKMTSTKRRLRSDGHTRRIWLRSTFKQLI